MITPFPGLLRLAVIGLSVTAAIPAAAQTLNVQLAADIRSSQPGVNRDSITDSVMLNVAEGLVAGGQAGNIVPMLADAWDVSADGLRYTFRLREGVPFHNGQILTAEDVKFSIDKLLADPSFGCKGFFDGSRGTTITSVDVAAPMTVTITLEKPDAMFLGYMAQSQCGAMGIVHRDSFNADGSWNSPIATGPFVFGDWKRGERLNLKKFDGYAALEGEADGYGGRKEVLVDEVNFVIVPDRSTAVAALRSGDLDILPFMSPDDAETLKSDAGLTLNAEPHGGMITMLFQTSDPLMSHPAMRKAFVAALDIAQIVDAATYGFGIPNASLVAVGSAYHTDVHNAGYLQDPSQVKALLDEAGYKGEQITILTNRRSTINYDVAVIAQAMLQAAGINAQIEVMEWASQLDRFNAGTFQVMAFNYSHRADPALAYSAIVGAKADRANVQWDRPEASALLASSMQTADPAERQAIFDDLHRAFLNEVPMLMLANGLDVSAAAKSVTGYATWQGFSRLWGVSKAR